jgi:hypothetical protein
MSERNEREWA